MILADLFDQNQYGTWSTVIDSLGRRITRFGGEFMFNGMAVPEDLEVTVGLKGKFYVPVLDIYLHKMYLVPCNSENILLYHILKDKLGGGAIREHPYCTHVCINGIYQLSIQVPRVAEIRILDDGSGWINFPRDPDIRTTTFYMVDILYRLDLQGEIT